MYIYLYTFCVYRIRVYLYNKLFLNHVLLSIIVTKCVVNILTSYFALATVLLSFSLYSYQF